MQAEGMSKLLALMILFPLSLFEFILGIYMIVYGIHAVPLWLFILTLWGLGGCIGLVFHIFAHRKIQANGYMEVSNYSNLNKLGRDKL